MSASSVNEQTVLLKIQTEMDRHLLEHDAPAEVFGFLHQYWARLLTSIFMTKGNQHPDWGAGWDTVNALLWSLSPKHSRTETEKMLHILPALLARIHEGCATLSIPEPERDALFERLVMMHAAVARAGLRYGEPVKTSLIPPSQASDMGAVVNMAELKVGDRVYFHLSDHACTLNLNWISPAGSMFLFSNDQGLDALTLTRARLAERFAQGKAVLQVG